MSTRTEFALPGLAGAFVVAAVLLAAWVARDSSADTDADAPPPVHESAPRELYSIRGHRARITRTAIPLEQQRIREADTAAKVAAQ